MKRQTKYNLETFILLLPFLIIFMIFGIFPIGYSFFMSFTDYSGINPHYNFVGLSNYIRAFQDEVFLIALKNTFILLLGQSIYNNIFIITCVIDK
ncbi:carbohydrate ABC transporter permease [Marinitoga lauensis]|uniref:carbohydrate ABC transporter permease n=1 Tax=Marinitoga lauensis TaxID=2201189 RepID=UPI00197E5DB5|nr:sugar ABC transporter permease [Marinitoga lauensis]